VVAGVLERRFILHMPKRGEALNAIEPHRRHPSRRWVVERTHAWHNKFRRLLVRWERTFDNYLAMVDLASTLITYRILARYSR
jgi:hypothetical protein